VTPGTPPPADDVNELRIRELILGVLAEHRDTVEATLVKALKNPKLVLAIAELAAKLTHEIGPKQDGGGLVGIEIVTRLPLNEIMRNGAAVDESRPALGPAKSGDDGPRKVGIEDAADDVWQP
jgi:hypothetical protein